MPLLLDPLNAWLSQPIVEQIGWVLVHFVWQGALVAGLLAGALALMRREQARLRYAVSLVALTVLLALPAATWMTLPSPAPSGGDEAIAVQAISVGEAASAVSATPTATAPTAWTTLLQSTIDGSLPWLVAGWLVGVLLLGGRLLGGWVYAARLRRRHARPIDAVWQRRVDDLADRLGLRRVVRVWQSSHIDVPMVMGWLRPIVLVPAGVLTGLPPQQVDALIAHELSHIQRHDVLVGWTQVVAETLFFYHPAVWWVSRQLRTEREHCCDDRAVAVCRDRLTYARALTTLATQRTAQPAGALAASDGPLLTRVRRLVKPSSTTSTRDRMTAALALGGVLAMLVVVGACATQRPASPEGTTAQASRSAEPSSTAARADAPDSTDAAERAVRTVVRIAPQDTSVTTVHPGHADSNNVVIVWTEGDTEQWVDRLDSLDRDIRVQVERVLAANDTIPRPPMPLAPRVFPGDSLSAVFPDIDVPGIDADVWALDSLRMPRAPVPPPAIYFDRDTIAFDAFSGQLADSLRAGWPRLRGLPDRLAPAQLDSLQQRIRREMRAHRDEMRRFSEEHRERMEQLHRELRERMLEEQPERLREQADRLRRQAE
ncbi:MAG: hypothetical protein GVY35_09735, partial [Bacteroidetes bacterium]|nr:hypothetical protein [Bacteroidota bacterium]